MPSDIEIAQAAKLQRVSKVAQDRLGIGEEHLEPYGHYKAKVSLKYLDTLKGKKDGKLVLVTAISPTPAGEGKTTTTVGRAALHAEHRPERRLAQADHRLLADVRHE